MKRLWQFALPLACAGCSGWQSALQPEGSDAADLDRLFQIFLLICGAIWLLVMLALLLSLLRHRKASGNPWERDAAGERRIGAMVSGAVAATVLIIAFLTVMSYAATRDISGGASNPLVVQLRGYQWWWQVTYADPRPDRMFVTANEIHVPVGRPVRIELSAADVIHSFWVPNLSGKQDLIPGRDNSLTFTASQPGIYRGQCAQFCGLQHAHMAILVVAETPTAFAAWRAGQIETAADVPAYRRGRDFFLSHACAGCHAIRGTPAAGTLGPDLTHIASRRYLGAGLMPVTPGSLAAWIADPQTAKPGNNMPLVPMGSDELIDLSAYLASLR